MVIQTLKRLFKTQTETANDMTPWHAAGQNLPANASAFMPLAIPAAQPLPTWPDVRRQDVDIEEVTRMIVVDLLQCPLQFLKIVGQTGRVVLALYQPHNHYDPLLPFPLVDLGDAFKKEFRAMALELSTWVDEMFALEGAVDDYNAYNGYIHRAPRRPQAVSAALYYGEMAYHMERAIKIARESNLLTPQEWNYFNYQLRLCIAQPDRFTQYDNEEWRDKWQMAIGINNSLSGGR